MEKFDIGIIGGGPGGYSAALYAASMGQSVVLFEKDEVGGTCLNRGCIPTKAFLHIADSYSKISSFEKIGIGVEKVNLDINKALEFKENVVSKLRKGLELTLKNAGVTVVKASAEIVSKNIIRADVCDYACNRIIVATGSKPKEIQGLEFDHNFVLSSDDILKMETVPKSVLIVGSGAIGIEWARILSSFGSAVTIVELADRLCPLSDWEVSKRIERQFKMKKIKTYLSTSVSKIEKGRVILSNEESIEPEKILVAVGRETVIPERTYGAEIIGDASAEIMLAHYAVSQAKESILNIKFNKKIVPSIIYGSPEIAWIGDVCNSKEDEAEYDTSQILISALGKAHCDDELDGFIKIYSKAGLIKGASIVSPEASALIQQIAIAMENNVSVDDMKKVCYAHPTYSEGIFESLMRL